ncbi:MAG: transposase [Ignavibacteria bacterium]|nr:transposase [Ignavibacteria bacterium]
MRRAKRTFDESFKRNAISLVRSGRTLQSVADELQISKQLISRWNQQERVEEEPGSHSAAELRVLLAAATKRASRAEMERDILKKAVSIFSHPTRND